MGFGIMFFGCFLLVEAWNLEILGFLLMFFGIRTAAKYCNCFDVALKMCYGSFLFGGLKLLMMVLRILDINFLGKAWDLSFDICYMLFLMAFYTVFFKGVASIAEETDMPHIKRMAYTGTVLMFIFLASSRAINIVLSQNAFAAVVGSLKDKLAGTALLLSLLVTVIAAIITFNCYMRICLEGDEDMERKIYPFKSPLDFYDKNQKNKKK